MDISLNKALKLRSKLEAALSSVELPLSTQVSVFVEADRQSPQAAIGKAAGDLQARLDEKLRISSILAHLRIAIAKANAGNGIEEILAGIAEQERKIAFNKLIANATLAPVDEAAKGEIEVAHRRVTSSEDAGSHYGHGHNRATVTFSIVSEAMRDTAREQIAEATRAKEDIEDRRVAANAGTRIAITEDDAAFLREMRIL